MTRNAKLRQICRSYLKKLRKVAYKRGLKDWIKQTIKDTNRSDCSPTEKECEMLARLVDDERIQRTDIPPLLSKTYRECTDNDDFDKIKKLHRVGLYSKVDTMLYAESLKNKIKTKKKLWK